MTDIKLVTESSSTLFSEKYILSILENDSKTVGHGEKYVGRPVTKIYSNAECVIKLKTEYDLNELQSTRFIAQATKREIDLNICHPKKIWFLLYKHDEGNKESIIIGNITEKLTALNHSDGVFQKLDTEKFTTNICLVIDKYLATAIKHDLSLDLCLSNFGINDKNELYYLDDDYYRWDDFGSLPDFLANLIRTQEWLNEELIAQIGAECRKSVILYFNDSHCAIVIAEKLRHKFVSNEKAPLLKKLVTALYSQQKFSYQSDNSANIIALIADIHSNAPALETALEYITSREINDILVLGDIVGYGPHPQQCIDMLQGNNKFLIIRGNHDHAVAMGNLKSGITSVASWALQWTIDNISDNNKIWLSQLSPYLKNKNWLAVHGAPQDKTFFNGYVYQMSYVENLDNLAERDIKLCFHGHTHIPKSYFRVKGVDSESVETKQNLISAQHALICPGSIGQPRNSQTGVQMAIINIESCEIEFLQLDYNIQKTLSDMKKYKFPAQLAQRLEQGL